MGGCSNECYILIIAKNVEDIHLQEKNSKNQEPYKKNQESHKRMT